MQILNNNEHKLIYFCNSAGDLDPEHELTDKARTLYYKFWQEGLGCYMYVVNYEGSPAIAMNYLFDKGFLEDITTSEQMNMSQFFRVIWNYSEELEKNRFLNQCSILVGENTDPDGHELMVIVPYERCKDITSIAGILNNLVYPIVSALVLSSLQEDKKNSVSKETRDNLLITMGCRAGSMECLGSISLPEGIQGESELAAFIVNAVDFYIEKEVDYSFDLYIEAILEAKYKI